MKAFQVKRIGNILVLKVSFKLFGVLIHLYVCKRKKEKIISLSSCEDCTSKGDCHDKQSN